MVLVSCGSMMILILEIAVNVQFIFSNRVSMIHSLNVHQEHSVLDLGGRHAKRSRIGRRSDHTNSTHLPIDGDQPPTLQVTLHVRPIRGRCVLRKAELSRFTKICANVENNGIATLIRPRMKRANDCMRCRSRVPPVGIPAPGRTATGEMRYYRKPGMRGTDRTSGGDRTLSNP